MLGLLNVEPVFVTGLEGVLGLLNVGPVFGTGLEGVNGPFLYFEFIRFFGHPRVKTELSLVSSIASDQRSNL